jgi:LacI family transcriptional regulator
MLHLKTMTKVTIKDIALRAGVSTGTVSRVLRKQGPISEKADAAVWQAARDLNYTLPTRARSTSTHTPRRLGMLIAGFDLGQQQNSFFAEVVSGASTEADRRDLSISIAPLSVETGIQPALLRRGEIDGLIVAGVPIPLEQATALSQLPFPVVFIGRYLEDQPHSYVSPENLEGGRMAAKALINLGHHQLAVISGPRKILTFNDRFRGTQEALQGSDVALHYFESDDFNEAAGYKAMHALLETGPVPTAVLALSDWMAFGALRAMRERGLRVPEDVSIIGFSDLPTAGLVEPPLTTVHIPQRYLGALAVHLVHALVEGEVNGPVSMMVPVTLVERASTAPIRPNP